MVSPGSVDAYDFSILIIRDKWDFSLGEIIGRVLLEEVSEKGESKGSGDLSVFFVTTACKSTIISQ